MSIITNATFGGTAFQEIFEGQLAAEPDSGVEYTITKIPGGSNFNVQTAGAGARTLDMPIGCSAASLNALRTKADNKTRASLVYHAGTTSATLMKVKNVRKVAIVDAYRATLELIMG